MRRVLPLSAATLLLGSGAALAEPEPFRVSGLPSGGSLTIREAPDADAAPVETIPVGRRLLGFGCTKETPSGNTWCRVKFGPAVGWARRRYLSPD
ncbi:SH3 domain-containing protein [Methylobacterium gnaphalii]|uniref:SH3b domain-containing protein n=1 Tax=Methylobacterium gnaphalii TaxID=1010610 RepID=A0A512JEE8_9HYPH|nr:SH3 domain-containing protein [Methylobacterium gnaphalii]GEP08323.1 hypothetical protein MGN01_01680 [Methylobacterium gnaphalii]GJD67903.1 hypothetical protein MMMDOFMJ_0821 [Methylobacterium gnaphalii]GLS51046.1 hypothetical protein GCM10007885_39000 [Methylobacterium gnaphalii]